MGGFDVVGIDFVAPKKVSDPLVAKISVYAALAELSGAELSLAQSKIKEIGAYLVKKYPELKMCASKYLDTDESFETEYGEAPVFPASVVPTHLWSPASKEEILTDSVVPPLVAGVVVSWRRRKESEMVCTTLEPFASE